MATIRTETTGKQTILVVMPSRKRKTIRLLTSDTAAATEAGKRIQEFADRLRDGEQPSKAAMHWLSGQPDVIRDRLERAGLVAMRSEKLEAIEAAKIAKEAETAAKEAAAAADAAKQIETTLGELTKRFRASKRDKKDATLITFDNAIDNLHRHFGVDRRISSITFQDAAEWRTWLKTEGNRREGKRKPKDDDDKPRTDLADNTVRRRCGIARQIFRVAIKAKQIEVNPFSELQSTLRPNAKRMAYVSVPMVLACIEKAPCSDWRTIIALCRFGGLRCPSEVLRLRWVDVDLPGGRMIVHATKTEHHEGSGIRSLPIFPDLEPYLQQAWDVADEGTEFVINRYREPVQNMRTTFQTIIKRAGQIQWPKLFQNLRSSCETDLLRDTGDVKTVAKWMGHSEAISLMHYAQVNEELERDTLTKVKTRIGQKPAHATGTARACKERHTAANENGTLKNAVNTVFSGVWMGDTELESVTSAV